MKKIISMIVGNRQGVASELGTRCLRPDSVSNPSRCRVLFTFLLCLTLGVGNVWAVTGAINATSEIILPAGSTTSYTKSYWQQAGAPAYSTTNDNTNDITISNVKVGSLRFYHAGYDSNASNWCTLQKNNGYLETVITSVAGVDVIVYMKSNGGGSVKVSLSGADADVSMSGTTAATRSISTTSNTATLKITCASNAAQVGYIKITPKTSSCTNSVSVSKVDPENGSISVSSASVATCSDTESDRRVTVSVVPGSCYVDPVAASVTQTGTTATLVGEGPTWNSTTSKWDYVYQFAKNATGETEFSLNITAKKTYKVQYNTGSTTHTSGNEISGSEEDGTKTCGVNMTLPDAVFTTTGYTQTGWAIADGGAKVYELNATNYGVDEAKTLYPAWTPVAYSVTWKVNKQNYTTGGGSASVNYGSKIETMASAPASLPCGEKFIGWTNEEDYVHGESPLYTKASDFPTATGDQIFYAVVADYKK